METILRVKQIEKIYGNKGSITRAIEDISFEVKKGEFVGIMGPSGSGKTTLLNCISTIDTVTSGHILIGKDDITKMKSSQLYHIELSDVALFFCRHGTEVRFNRHGIYIEEYSGLRNDQ